MTDSAADISLVDKPAFLFSLHDVTPFHLDRIRRAEEFFHRWGVEKAAYLLVPDYHRGRSTQSPADFENWISGPHPVAVDWLLHGFYHLEGVTKEAKGGRTKNQWRLSGALGDSRIERWMNMGKRRFLTAGEGEFLDLSEEEIKWRLDRGLEYFRRVAPRDIPAGFVAPAWLYNKHLVPVLRKRLIPWTEDHHGLVRVQGGQRLGVPVITWATRTRGRRFGSLLVCPLQLHWWFRRPLIRIAVHPYDFDYTETIRSIEYVVRRVIDTRKSLTYQELICDTP